MKIIAFYLPQFHTFPENDKWWGKGFTEWTNTRKALPLFENHYQPRIPINNNYYNLSDNKTFQTQIDLAKKFGIHGFCFYHYWFKDGKKLMQTPIENYLKDKSLSLPFCLCWANEPWTRAWDGGEKEIIMPQEYGDKNEWEQHFNYLLKFFEDDRYIKIDGFPILVIYRPEIIPKFDEMIKFWRFLAKKHGFRDIKVLSQSSFYNTNKSISKEIDFTINYEPGFTDWELANKKMSTIISNFFRYPKCICNKIRLKFSPNKSLNLLDYDEFYKKILSRKTKDNSYPGAFTDWDNTARRNNKARIFVGSTPQKFESYLTQLIKKEREKDFLFITAWNEWAEGAYLEPDLKHGYGYLKALRNALNNNNIEF